jgi:hypothetical protein
MVWVKCTTFAECKTIRIAASSVMDGCGDHYIAQCQVFGFINGFLEKWRFVPTAYLEGTADDLRWSCLIGHRSYLSMEFPLS